MNLRSLKAWRNALPNKTPIPMAEKVIVRQIIGKYPSSDHIRPGRYWIGEEEHYLPFHIRRHNGVYYATTRNNKVMGALTPQTVGSYDHMELAPPAESIELKLTVPDPKRPGEFKINKSFNQLHYNKELLDALLEQNPDINHFKGGQRWFWIKDKHNKQQLVHLSAGATLQRGDNGKIWVLTKELGKGGFGSVHRIAQEVVKRHSATPQREMRPVERKRVVKKQKISSEGERGEIEQKKIEQEYKFYQKAHGVNLERVFFQAGERHQYGFFTMEEFPGQPLSMRPNSHLPLGAPLPPLSPQDQLLCALSLIKSVSAFGLVHRDLKPANVLYDEKTKRCALLDFGLSAKKGDENKKVGTELFMAPEVADPWGFNVASVHSAIDVFSLAGVIGLAFNGDISVMFKSRIDAHPIRDNTQYARLGLDFSQVDNSLGVRDFLSKMASVDYKKRPSLEKCFDFFVTAYAKFEPKNYAVPALETELKKLVQDLEKETEYYELRHYKDTAKTFMGGMLPIKSPDQSDSIAKQKQNQLAEMKNELTNLTKMMRADKKVAQKYEEYKKMAEGIFDKYLNDPVLNTKRARLPGGKPRSIKRLKILKSRLDAHLGNYYFEYLQKNFPGPLPKPPVKNVPQEPMALPRPLVGNLPPEPGASHLPVGELPPAPVKSLPQPPTKVANFVIPPSSGASSSAQGSQQKKPGESHGSGLNFQIPPAAARSSAQRQDKAKGKQVHSVKKKKDSEAWTRAHKQAIEQIIQQKQSRAQPKQGKSTQKKKKKHKRPAPGSSGTG